MFTNFFHQLGDLYGLFNNYLDTYPLFTKATTTAAIGILGDGIAQYHEQQLRANTKQQSQQQQSASSSPTPKGGSPGSSGSDATAATSNITTSTTNNNNNRSTLGFVFRYDLQRGLTNIISNLFLTAPIYHYGYGLLEQLLPVLSDDEALAMNATILSQSPSSCTSTTLFSSCLPSSLSSMTIVLGNSTAALCQVLIDCIVFDALFVFLMYLSAATVERYGTSYYATFFSRGESPSSTRSATSSRKHPLFSRQALKSNLVPAIVASWEINIFIIPIEYILFRYFPLRVRVMGMTLVDLIWDAVVGFVIHFDDHGLHDNQEEQKPRVEETVGKEMAAGSSGGCEEVIPIAASSLERGKDVLTKRRVSTQRTSTMSTPSSSTRHILGCDSYESSLMTTEGEETMQQPVLDSSSSSGHDSTSSLKQKKS